MTRGPSHHGSRAATQGRRRRLCRWRKAVDGEPLRAYDDAQAEPRPGFPGKRHDSARRTDISLMTGTSACEFSCSGGDLRCRCAIDERLPLKAIRRQAQRHRSRASPETTVRPTRATRARSRSATRSPYGRTLTNRRSRWQSGRAVRRSRERKAARGIGGMVAADTRDRRGDDPDVGALHARFHPRHRNRAWRA